MSLVTQYQSSWPNDFVKIRNYLDTGITYYHSIEHTGSTSVPGMVAKPIIDIIIVVQLGKMSDMIEELSRLGYSHQGDLGIPGREAFDYLPAHLQLPTHHLYTCYPDANQLLGHVAFRLFMRESPEWREKLSALKLECDKKFDSNRQQYMDGKREMVEHIIKLAREKHPNPKISSRPIQRSG